jgi:hypothetical protein
MKRIREALDWIVLRDRGSAKRARLDAEIQSELLELPSEMRNLIMVEHLPLRPLLQLASANRLLKADVDRAFVTIFKRDILAQLDPSVPSLSRPLTDEERELYGDAWEHPRDGNFHWSENIVLHILNYGRYQRMVDPVQANIQKLQLTRFYKNVVKAVAELFGAELYNAVRDAYDYGRSSILRNTNRAQSDSWFEFSDPRDTRLAFAIEVRADYDAQEHVDINMEIVSTAPDFFREAVRSLMGSLSEIRRQTKANALSYRKMDELFTNAFMNILLGGTPRLIGMCGRPGKKPYILGVATNLQEIVVSE